MTLTLWLLAVALALRALPALNAQTDTTVGMSNHGKNNPDTGMVSDMAPHMRMTALRPVKEGDQEKARQVLIAARKVCEKYKDYKVALADGFHIFRPNVPQARYHFNNPEYAHEAAEHFNPEHPTSLLYEKKGDGYKLIGVMYTAPKWTSVEELNERIPLSIARWHEHVNLCLPPPNRNKGAHFDPRFGPEGSISTQAECDAAGGRFVAQIFGWMVHVYPFEQKPEDIWSFARQMQGEK